jgi:hypothetical protein
MVAVFVTGQAPVCSAIAAGPRRVTWAAIATWVLRVRHANQLRGRRPADGTGEVLPRRAEVVEREQHGVEHGAHRPYRSTAGQQEAAEVQLLGDRADHAVEQERHHHQDHQGVGGTEARVRGPSTVRPTGRALVDA